MEQIVIRLLKAEEIECRIGTINEKGVSLLLYKNSRVDQKILDETFGCFGWQRHHQCINGNLYCTVELWDESKKQWIAKQDVGTESYAEKEKGQASDSFKRACVSVGIGRELYTAPFIWISEQKCNIQRKDDKYITYDKFSVKEIVYDDNREIIGLTILNQDKRVVYAWKENMDTVQKPIETAPTSQQIKELNQELDRTGVVLNAVLERYGIQNMNEMTQEIFKSAMNGLKKTKTKGKIA